MNIFYFQKNNPEPTTALPVSLFTKVITASGKQYLSEMAFAYVIYDKKFEENDLRDGWMKLDSTRVLAPLSKNSVVTLKLPEKTLYFGVKASGVFVHGETEKSSKIKKTDLLKEDYNLSPLGEKAYEWLKKGSTGLSSESLCYHTVPEMQPVLDKIRQKSHFNEFNHHPSDPSDFNKCYKFLNAVPEAKLLLSTMSNVSPEWKRLVEKWDELTATFETEIGLSRAPKTYQMMQDIVYQKPVSKPKSI